MDCIYNVDARKSPALLCYVANKSFWQQWLFEKVEESNTNIIERDNDSQELPPVMKRRWKEIGHLDFALSKRSQ